MQTSSLLSAIIRSQSRLLEFFKESTCVPPFHKIGDMCITPYVNILTWSTCSKECKNVESSILWLKNEKEHMELNAFLNNFIPEGDYFLSLRRFQEDQPLFYLGSSISSNEGSLIEPYKGKAGAEKGRYFTGSTKHLNFCSQTSEIAAYCFCRKF